MRDLGIDECSFVSGGMDVIVVTGSYTPPGGTCVITDPYMIYAYMQYLSSMSQQNFYSYASAGGGGGSSGGTTITGNIDGVSVGYEGSGADIQVKSGASLAGLSQEMQDTFSEIEEAWDDNATVPPVITSGSEGYSGDGVHGTNSLHYSGDAVDLRTNNLTSGQAQNIVNDLQNSLGSDYDVVLESDHIHLEYDP